MKDGEPSFPCNFCGFDAAAIHEGGFTMPDGTEYSGHFCDEKCFKNWRTWKSALHIFKRFLNQEPEPVHESDPQRRIGEVC